MRFVLRLPGPLHGASSSGCYTEAGFHGGQRGATEGPLPACDAQAAEPLEASIASSVKWVHNNGFPRAVVRKRVPDTYGELVLQSDTDDDEGSDAEDDDDDNGAGGNPVLQGRRETEGQDGK